MSVFKYQNGDWRRYNRIFTSRVSQADSWEKGGKGFLRSNGQWEQVWGEIPLIFSQYPFIVQIRTSASANSGYTLSEDISAGVNSFSDQSYWAYRQPRLLMTESSSASFNSCSGFSHATSSFETWDAVNDTSVERFAAINYVDNYDHQNLICYLFGMKHLFGYSHRGTRNGLAQRLQFAVHDTGYDRPNNMFTVCRVQGTNTVSSGKPQMHMSFSNSGGIEGIFSVADDLKRRASLIGYFIVEGVDLLSDHEFAVYTSRGVGEYSLEGNLIRWTDVEDATVLGGCFIPEKGLHVMTTTDNNFLAGPRGGPFKAESKELSYEETRYPVGSDQFFVPGGTRPEKPAWLKYPGDWMTNKVLACAQLGPNSNILFASAGVSKNDMEGREIRSVGTILEDIVISLDDPLKDTLALEFYADSRVVSSPSFETMTLTLNDGTLVPITQYSSAGFFGAGTNSTHVFNDHCDAGTSTGRSADFVNNTFITTIGFDKAPSEKEATAGKWKRGSLTIHAAALATLGIRFVGYNLHNADMPFLSERGIMDGGNLIVDGVSQAVNIENASDIECDSVYPIPYPTEDYRPSATSAVRTRMLGTNQYHQNMHWYKDNLIYIWAAGGNWNLSVIAGPSRGVSTTGPGGRGHCLDISNGYIYSTTGSTITATLLDWDLFLDGTTSGIVLDQRSWSAAPLTTTTGRGLSCLNGKVFVVRKDTDCKMYKYDGATGASEGVIDYTAQSTNFYHGWSDGQTMQFMKYAGNPNIAYHYDENMNFLYEVEIDSELQAQGIVESNTGALSELTTAQADYAVQAGGFFPGGAGKWNASYLSSTFMCVGVSPAVTTAIPSRVASGRIVIPSSLTTGDTLKWKMRTWGINYGYQHNNFADILTIHGVDGIVRLYRRSYSSATATRMATYDLNYNLIADVEFAGMGSSTAAPDITFTVPADVGVDLTTCTIYFGSGMFWPGESCKGLWYFEVKGDRLNFERSEGELVPKYGDVLAFGSHQATIETTLAYNARNKDTSNHVVN